MSGAGSLTLPFSGAALEAPPALSVIPVGTVLLSIAGAWPICNRLSLPKHSTVREPGWCTSSASLAWGTIGTLRQWLS